MHNMQTIQTITTVDDLPQGKVWIIRNGYAIYVKISKIKGDTPYEILRRRNYPRKNVEQIIDDMKEFTRCSLFIDVENLVQI